MPPPLSPNRRTTAETTAVVGTVAAVFAASTTFIFTANGRPLWIGLACGALVASGICWALWFRVRSYLCILRYRRRIHDSRHMNSVMLVGAVKRALPGLTLEDVYVDVSLRNDETEIGGQKVYGSSTGRPGRRATLDEFLLDRTGAQFAVYGMPGSGKSTLLRSTALRMSRKIRPSAPMPILVVLAHHMAQIIDDPGIDLASIAASARWLDSDVIPAHEVKRWLSKGRCMIMLDGLDEVPEQHRPAVMLWAEQQHGSYPDCNLVVTSRELGFESARFDAADLVLEVCPLTRGQIEDFVKSCYRAFRKNGEVNTRAAAAEESELLAGIRSDHALYDLASTPLLLQLMVYVHRNSDDGLPASRGELYQRMVEMLLYKRRDGVKLAAPTNRVDVKPKFRIVQRLALEMMLNEWVHLDPLPLIKELVEEFGIEETAQELLSDLHDNGLLSSLDPNSDMSMFAHLSFQEYLAAKELHEQGRVEVLASRIDQRWWRNTALFWATSYDPDPLIEACVNAGTPESWTLAIELQKEVELSGGGSELRFADRINAFLAEDHAVDSEEYRVACIETIDRNLRDVHFIEDDLALCDEPVNKDVYQLFARAERAAGLRPSAHRLGRDGEIMGLWPGEVESFLRWLAQFDHSGFQYRLPHADELESPPLAPVIRGRTAGGLHAVWVDVGGRARPRYADFRSNWGFKVPPLKQQYRIRADWQFMLDQFHFDGWSDAAGDAAVQIRSACAALQKTASSYKKSIYRVAPPSDPYSVSGRILASHRQYADALAKTAEDLAWYAGSDSISLLAILRLASSIEPGPSRVGQHKIPAIPAATLSEQFDSLLKAARSAVQVSYRLHCDRFREDDGTPGFMRTAGALLLASRLPADGRPSAFKFPKKLAEMIYTAEPVLPQQLPGLLDATRLRHGRDGKPRSGLRPHQQVDDILSEMRQPLLDLVTRRTEVDLAMLASMRTALYAVALWMEVDDADPLWSCVMGLAVIEARHRRTIHMDESMLLVREDLS